MQLRKEAWKKIQDFNGVWTCDLAITGVMLYQLSYEATDIGSRSIIVGSYVPVKEIISAVHIWFISYIINTHFFHGNILTFFPWKEGLIWGRGFIWEGGLNRWFMVM